MSFPQASPSRFPTRPSPSGDGAPKRKLLDRVRDVCRLKHYSLRTEQAYVHWIKKYILCFNKQPTLIPSPGVGDGKNRYEFGCALDSPCGFW